MIKMTLSQPEIRMRIEPAKVVYQGGVAWISGKYGRRMENVGKDG